MLGLVFYSQHAGGAARAEAQGAGIPVRDMVAACGAGHLEATPLLDLNHTETSAGGLEVCAALHPALDRLVLLQVRAMLWVCSALAEW